MSDFKESVEIDIKRPKRVLHFSDGVIEEYDGEEEDNLSGLIWIPVRSARNLRRAI